jgi:predicted  nucleic acid-binding Zn-ribbon protein
MQTACENCETQVAATNQIRQALDKAQASELETTKKLAALRVELRQVAAERDELRHKLSEVRAQIALFGKSIELWTRPAGQSGPAGEVSRG